MKTHSKLKRKMMKASRKPLLAAALLLMAVQIFAGEDVRGKKTTPKASYKTEAGDCVTPTAQFDMDINNVRARLLTGGDAWWNLSEARYEVPKGDGTGAYLNALFAGAIWITGYDAGGNLKCAAQRYRQGGDDYWPGPIVGGLVDKATCNKYDRFFNVYGANIDKAQTAFLQKGSQTTIADIPKDVLSWPAKGNQYLATDPSLLGETFQINENMAPFKDYDNDGIYDPVKGDYPVIPCRKGDPTAYGDQMVFWVFNDVGNIHTESNGQSIGIQVNSLAFAFQTTDDINNMTFYSYEIINKSSNQLFQTYISQWADPDLGCFQNDRVGCDTAQSLGIVYNGSTPDPDCQGVSGYGSELPLIGIDFFEGPLSDDSIPVELGLSSFVYFTNGAPNAQTDPGSAAQYRNYQTGFWNDGSPFTEGGTGYGGTTPTKYIFPGNPSDPSAWSEMQPAVSAVLTAGDRRMVQTSGPFTLKPGSPQYVTVGCVFVRPAGGVGVPPNFQTTIIPADLAAQALFNTCFKLVDGPDAPTMVIRELDKQILINLQNLPGSNNVGESYDQVDGKTAQKVNSELGGIGDSTYTFEGYKVYQIANSRVSATELDDPTKALLLAQVDVKNGISKIINFEKDAILGLDVPVLKVDGNNSGITNSFNVTDDLFATGDNKQLINHKTYYYTVIAYAYNNYKQFDQAHPLDGGQKDVYLQGRGNFKIYSAIPHITDPRNGGTTLHANWGDGVEVMRIEGKGNGGNVLSLTPETIEKILGSGSYAFSDTLTYSKGADPIGFKITDPVALKNGDFELQFADTPGSKIGVSTRWFLREVNTNDTIWSDRNLDRPYEQQIALTKNGETVDYGFSIKIGTPGSVYTLPTNYLAPNGSPNRYVYDATEESSLEYQNATEPWLSFLKDQGVYTPTNWIRSGTSLNDPTTQSPQVAAAAGVYDDNWYYTSLTPPNPAYGNNNTEMSDSLELYEKILNGTWAPYCLTCNYSNRNATGLAPAFAYGPGFKWKNYSNTSGTIPPQNTLDRVHSVDVVITPDKSKWSRCIVFETGEDEGVNDGDTIAPNGKKAHKGQIRMAYSRDWNNGASRDYLSTTQSDTGRSWFPGYAIDVETGERLNLCFGESSDQGDQNGRDMLWNPTKNLLAPVGGIPYFGGKHFIYVMESKYDEGAAAQRFLLDRYDSIGSPSIFVLPNSMGPFYRQLMWTSIPYLAEGYDFAADGNGEKYLPPSSVTIKLRVERPYERMQTISTSGVDSLPRYRFSIKDLAPTEDQPTVAKTACDLINVVPNPYLAYSAYETDQNSTQVKITNLPNKANITIYSLDGTIIRKLSRAIDVDPTTQKKIEISDGMPTSEINLENSLEWDLKNDKSIPIASGIYLIHVEVPSVCQRTLKWFGAIRPADTSNF